MGTTYGYIRVSGTRQNISRQETLMKSLKIDEKNVYKEKVSGKNKGRPQLNALLDTVESGDCIVVESYSRFARSTRDLLDLVEQLDKKNVEFKSIKENIDTSTPTGRLALTIFAGIAQFEREILLERQAEGIAEAKKAGKYKGRKPIDIDKDKFDKYYTDWKAGRYSAAEIQRLLKISSPTFYRRVKDYEVQKKSRGATA